jgi:hypothetical protein
MRSERSSAQRRQAGQSAETAEGEVNQKRTDQVRLLRVDKHRSESDHRAERDHVAAERRCKVMQRGRDTEHEDERFDRSPAKETFAHQNSVLEALMTGESENLISIACTVSCAQEAKQRTIRLGF